MGLGLGEGRGGGKYVKISDDWVRQVHRYVGTVR